MIKDILFPPRFAPPLLHNASPLRTPSWLFVHLLAIKSHLLYLEVLILKIPFRAIYCNCYMILPLFL